MRRFFLQNIDPESVPIVIKGAEARHMIRVLRMMPGEEIVLIEGGGRRFRATIRDVRRGCVTVDIISELPGIMPSPVKITLAQALIRARRMDIIIEKCTELGVNTIIPFLSSRSIIRMDKHKHESRLKHWQGVAISAVKQSDALTPPEITQVMDFRDMLDNLKERHATKVILWEQDKRISIKKILTEREKRDHFIGIVGPEGGFSKAEIQWAKESGFIPATLGRRILRAETASISMVSLVQYEWGDLN